MRITNIFENTPPVLLDSPSEHRSGQLYYLYVYSWISFNVICLSIYIVGYLLIFFEQR